MEKNLNFLDRNEFNYSPSKEVVEALKNFDINKLCFYTRIYDEKYIICFLIRTLRYR